MKDIYELLNDIDIDENEFEEMEVSEFEKAKVKKALKKSLNEKKKGRVGKEILLQQPLSSAYQLQHLDYRFLLMLAIFLS